MIMLFTYPKFSESNKVVVRELKETTEQHKDKLRCMLAHQNFSTTVKKGIIIRLPVCLLGKRKPTRKGADFQMKEFATPGANSFPQVSTTPEMRSYTLSPLRT